jgi:hypothetical protein
MGSFSCQKYRLTIRFSGGLKTDRNFEIDSCLTHRSSQGSLPRHILRRSLGRTLSHIPLDSSPGSLVGTRVLQQVRIEALPSMHDFHPHSDALDKKMLLCILS